MAPIKSKKSSSGKKAPKKAKVRKKAPSQRAGPIKKTLLIGDVVNKYPETVEVMLAKGFHCIGCHVSPFESIEQGAMVHGISGKELDSMISEMNSIALRKRGK